MIRLTNAFISLTVCERWNGRQEIRQKLLRFPLHLQTKKIEMPKKPFFILALVWLIYRDLFSSIGRTCHAHDLSLGWSGVHLHPKDMALEQGEFSICVLRAKKRLWTQPNSIVFKPQLATTRDDLPSKATNKKCCNNSELLQFFVTIHYEFVYLLEEHMGCQAGSCWSVNKRKVVVVSACKINL